jgi:hypothetical protein
MDGYQISGETYSRKSVGFHETLILTYQTTEDPEGHNVNFYHSENVKFYTGDMGDVTETGSTVYKHLFVQD